MTKIFIPDDYQSILTIPETQACIEMLKDIFSRNLRQMLNLKRVSAPLFLRSEIALNDDLGGSSKAVEFKIPAIPDTTAEIVQSLAKWKRFALHQYGSEPGEGLVTDMNAIRKDEELDNLHSVYVDQWDWERVISRDERNLDFLKEIVEKIHLAIVATSEVLRAKFPELPDYKGQTVYFIDAQELENLYPNEDAKMREYLIAKEHGVVFLIGIGKELRSGKPHDSRASDYDDWDLNGDLLFYDEKFDRVIEISSMGIRVDSDSLLKQLTLCDELDKVDRPYHKAILENELPLTIGGGIGQSRLSMLLLGKAHIGEVQSSIWDQETLDYCKSRGVKLL